MLEIIENQLKDKNPKCTFETFQKLKEHEIDEDEIKDFLASLLEIHTRTMLAQRVEFDEEVWKENLERMSNRVIDDINGKQLTSYQLEKNISRIKKEIGSIPNESEMVYDQELNTIESTLYGFYRLYGIDSRDANRIVMMTIQNLYGHIYSQTFDFFSEEDKKLYLLMDLLEEKCNPYMNDEGRAIVEKQIDMSTHENDKIIFTPMIKCLERIYRSIKFWAKENPKNGYFIFLSHVDEELFLGNPNTAFMSLTLKK